MKTERYLKLIFKRGSVIFRDVKSYTSCEELQTITIVYNNNDVAVLDLIHCYSILGKMINIKSNVTHINVSLTQDC